MTETDLFAAEGSTDQESVPTPPITAVTSQDVAADSGEAAPSAPAESASAPARGAATAVADGALSSMVLPELRALANRVGVKGSSGMRKSELIAAIREAGANGGQASNCPSPAPSRPRPAWPTAPNLPRPLMLLRATPPQHGRGASAVAPIGRPVRPRPTPQRPTSPPSRTTPLRRTSPPSRASPPSRTRPPSRASTPSRTRPLRPTSPPSRTRPATATRRAGRAGSAAPRTGQTGPTSPSSPVSGASVRAPRPRTVRRPRTTTRAIPPTAATTTTGAAADAVVASGTGVGVANAAARAVPGATPNCAMTTSCSRSPAFSTCWTTTRSSVPPATSPGPTTSTSR